MTTTFQKHQRRLGKAVSVRRRIREVSGRARMTVFRSLANISVQIIDDIKGHTLASASSLEKDVRAAIQGMNKTDAAKKVGALVAERAKRAGVAKVAFDRGSYKYHGRVKALADGAREAGLEF
jgi:large subunit ribosomal protein L18